MRKDKYQLLHIIQENAQKIYKKKKETMVEELERKWYNCNHIFDDRQDNICPAYKSSWVQLKMITVQIVSII